MVKSVTVPSIGVFFAAGVRVLDESLLDTLLGRAEFETLSFIRHRKISFSRDAVLKELDGGFCAWVSETSGINVHRHVRFVPMSNSYVVVFGDDDGVVTGRMNGLDIAVTAVTTRRTHARRKAAMHDGPWNGELSGT
jgi:hypothetical protein